MNLRENDAPTLDAKRSDAKRSTLPTSAANRLPPFATNPTFPA
jgi:hypothetical protein